MICNAVKTDCLFDEALDLLDVQADNEVHMLSGATASTVHVREGGVLTVESGATVSNVTVHSGGMLMLLTGSEAHGVHAKAGSRLYVASQANVTGLRKARKVNLLGTGV